MNDLAIGLDLGTSFTAAAVAHRGTVEMVSLGNHATAMPSAVFLREDGEFLVGDTAVRRGVDDTSRVAREFKRRMGDQTPILLSHSPYSAERLMALVLRHVMTQIDERFGRQPDAVALAYPANWGDYKVDLLRQAAQLAGIADALFVTEPEAAAVHFASGERVEPGEMIAVYDLGGGTFDAAVLQRTSGGFSILGRPLGIERLGGIDFDDAVVSHVLTSLGDPIERNSADPAMRSALARLRAECVAAKEALSADTDANIPVVLPGLNTQVRLTRPEFEAAIRPLVLETISVLRQAISSAGITADDLKAVVLAGGSSRIPLIAEMVRADIGRPLALDAHPKHTVALGAAMIARDSVEAPTVAAIPASGEPVLAMAPAAVAAEVTPPNRRTRRLPVVIGIAVLAAIAVVLGAFALGGDEDPGTDSSGGVTVEPTAPSATSMASTVPTATSPTGTSMVASVPSTTPVTSTVAPTVPPTTAGPTDTEVVAETTAPPEEVRTCTTPSGRCAFIDDITIVGDGYVVAYSTVGYEPLIDGGDDSYHLHFFFDTVALEEAGVPGFGPWVVWDLDDGGQKIFSGEEAFRPSAVPAGATSICATVATVGHAVDSGALADCVPLPS